MPEPYSIFYSFICFRYYSLYLNSLILCLKEHGLFTPSCSGIVPEARLNERHSKDTLKYSILIFSPPSHSKAAGTPHLLTNNNPSLCPTKPTHALSSTFRAHKSSLTMSGTSLLDSQRPLRLPNCPRCMRRASPMKPLATLHSRSDSHHNSFCLLMIALGPCVP